MLLISVLKSQFELLAEALFHSPRGHQPPPPPRFYHMLLSRAYTSHSQEQTQANVKPVGRSF